MKFLFVRHAKTKGNLERRYIGDLNEPLCKEGIEEARALAHSNALPQITRLITGPALRCRQTAEILFPNTKYELCPIVEIDFGIFKDKNADELIGNKDYENWLDTGCHGDIPGGDSVSSFKERCCESFEQITQTANEGTTGLIIHGGNIMSILERFALPKKDFYDYHISNCESYLYRWENGILIK